MRRLDALARGEVCDGAGDFQDAIIGAGRKGELLHRLLEQIAERRIERDELPDLRMGHAGVARDRGAAKARELKVAGRLHASGDRGRRLAGRLVAKIADRDGGRLDMDVDAVKERPADPRAVALNLSRRAAALVLRITKIPAGARVQRRFLDFTLLTKVGDKKRTPMKSNLDQLTASHTAFASFGELLNAPGYRPSLNCAKPDLRTLADAYDAAQGKRADSRRAFRYRA